MTYHEPGANARRPAAAPPRRAGSAHLVRAPVRAFRVASPALRARINAMKPRMPPMPTLLLVVLVSLAPGCAWLRGRAPSDATTRPAGQLTSRQTGDYERALRVGRRLLRDQGLQDKYDIQTATAYPRGDQWEVCFTPKDGLFKRLRKRCFVFSL